MEQIPKYIQLYEILKEQILKGIYKENDLLPSEKELCDSFSMNRATARQALTRLLNEGFILKQQGKGSIVISRKKRLGILSVKGFSQVAGAVKQTVKSIMIEKPQIKKWDENFFFDLSEIEKKTGCIYFRRIRFVGEDPVMIENTYIPNLNLPRFCSKKFINNSLFETLQTNYQIEIQNAEQELRAIKADDEMATLLKTKPGEPLIHIYLKFISNRSNLNVYSSLFCSTEKYAIANIE